MPASKNGTHLKSYSGDEYPVYRDGSFGTTLSGGTSDFHSGSLEAGKEKRRTASFGEFRETKIQTLDRRN